MPEKPQAELLRQPLSDALQTNLSRFRALYGLPDNRDPVVRPFECADTPCALIYLQGMAGEELIDRFVLGPLMQAQTERPLTAKHVERLLLTVGETTRSTEMRECSSAILDGKTLLLIDGCPEGLLIETRSYAHRTVDKTTSESVVIGPQEGFIEHLRTNITLIRRIVRSEALVTEMLQLGTALPTHIAILHLRGAASEASLSELKRRLMALDAPLCEGTGALMQQIEDHPFSIFPQMLETERPDRAARALADGQLVVLVDGSPYALIAPITVFHLLHTADDSFLRWPYGTFLRLIRTLGLVLSLLLPGFYIALTLFHPHMIPMDLLTSIAEARSNVPFPILVEILIMEASFYLINEAGTRIPSIIGPTIGIVGALILGQAAVSASIISPILIIVVALTGLGNFSIPNYGVSVGTQILRLVFILSGALLGIYGLVLTAAVILCMLCGMKSLGVPFLAPAAPWRPHNPDLMVRLPLWLQRKPLFFAHRPNWVFPHRSKGGRS